MRYTVSTVTLFCAIVALLLAVPEASMAQQLHESVSYEVIPSCVSPTPDKPTLPNQYFYRLTIEESVSEEHFEIVLDGIPVIQFNVATSDLPYVKDIGPLTHSIVGGSYHQYILRSLTTEIADTLFLPELVCGHSTDSGENAPGYYCNGLEGGIVAQASPEVLDMPSIPEKMYTYILVNRTTGLVVAKNFSGHFTKVSDLSDYEMHAFATSFEEAADFINSIKVDAALDQNDLSICYAFCGAFEVTTDCSSFDLRLQKDNRDVTVHSYGDTAIFDITIINEGRVTAYNISVQDRVPSGLIFEPSINPEWNENATSKMIDSITAGETITIPIRMIVDPRSSFIDIEIVAEIISGTSAYDKVIDAFDRDSNPDNDQPNEDDQDGTEITVIENLCNSTFDVVLSRVPSCEGEDVILTPEVIMSNEPVTWRWRYKGSVISREQTLVLSEDEVDPFGRYELTAIDNMGCVKIMPVDINMIDIDDRLSCYSDINVGINDNCQLNLHPGMLTNNRPPGIDDYKMKIEDAEGRVVDINDISAYGPDDILMASLINPCTDEVLCWTNLHLENKLFPKFELYYTPKETVCLQDDLSASELINNYNLHFDRKILTAEQFEDSLRQSVCIQEWEIDVVDQFIPGVDMCDDGRVMRIYQIYNQETPYPLDTAILILKNVLFESILLPEDVDNIACGDQLDPLSLQSVPSLIVGHDTVALDGEWVETTSASFCNFGVTYVDEVISEQCIWGAKKIMRTWDFGDWCSNVSQRHTQFLYIIDREAPVVTVSVDTITLTTQPYQCHVEVTPSEFTTVSDNCNQEVTYLSGGETIELPIGYHEVVVAAADLCQNVASEVIVFHVVEATPPVAVLHDILTLNFASDTSVTDHFITAAAYDVGSHDSQCGPVTIEIARKSEVDMTEFNGGDPSNAAMFHCTDFTFVDSNEDGVVSLDELFRERVDICCSDIGRTISLYVLITDESGNETRAEVQLEVNTKLEWSSCDDGDPCTTDDKSYGECGCAGVPIVSDVDGDDLVDCIDDEIIICLEGENLEISFSEIDSFLQLGAVGGPCDNDETAIIAGEIITPLGEPIEAVEVYANEEMIDMTSDVGTYALPPQEMYKRYELLPLKDDNPLNGVSAVDMVILQEYILGLRSINDPYLLIAADVNGDGKVSATDVVDMQRILLGNRNNWKGNRSWRFVIENFEWEDIRKPWSFQEINVISSLDKNMMKEDWIGVKTGDLNQDAIPNSNFSNSRSEETHIIYSQDKNLEKGRRTTLSFQARDVTESIEGLQLRLSLKDVKVEAINSGALSISSQDYFIDTHRGNVTIVWAKSENKETDDVLFEIELEALKNVSLQSAIEIDPVYHSMIVLPNDKTGMLDLEFDPIDVVTIQKEKAVMFQNQPNPFTGQTVIQFIISEDGQVDFQFYGANGELLLEKTGQYGSGNNAISLQHEDLRFYKGAIYYQMRYRGQTFTRTMVLTK